MLRDHCAYQLMCLPGQTLGIQTTAIDDDLDAFTGDDIDALLQARPSIFHKSGVLAGTVGFGVFGHVHLYIRQSHGDKKSTDYRLQPTCQPIARDEINISKCRLAEHVITRVSCSIAPMSAQLPLTVHQKAGYL